MDRELEHTATVRDKDEIGSFIHKLRQEVLEKTPESFAKDLNISLNSLKEIEEGNGNIPYDFFDKVEDVTNIHKKYILYDLPLNPSPIKRGKNTELHLRQRLKAQKLATIYKDLEVLYDEKEHSKLNHLKRHARKIITRGDDLEYLSYYVRESLDLDDKPIDMLNLLDNLLNVKLIPLALGNNVEFDGHYVCGEGTGEYIVFNWDKPLSRINFTLAHEFGHLLFEHQNKFDNERLDKFANTFAGNFLMPEDKVKEINTQLPEDKGGRIQKIVEIAYQNLISPICLLVRLKSTNAEDESLDSIEDEVRENTSRYRTTSYMDTNKQEGDVLPNYLEKILEHLVAKKEITRKKASHVRKQFKE